MRPGFREILTWLESVGKDDVDLRVELEDSDAHSIMRGEFIKKQSMGHCTLFQQSQLFMNRLRCSIHG